jgi:membrane associated rhomboid family serine protease
MDSQSTLWLYPLVLIAGFALILYVRMGTRWTWGFCLQALAMLLVAVTGLVFPAWSVACTSLGWGIFLLAIVVPRAILGRLERNLNLLQPEPARAEARRLRWFFWGAPGRFWSDMTDAMCAFMSGEREKAESIMGFWQNYPLPRAAREGLIGHLMTGKILLRDWSGIIEAFAGIKQQSGGRVPYGASIAAGRAYLELGDVRQALLCLEADTVQLARFGGDALNSIFIPFFALSGAESELDEAMAGAGGNDALPEYARLFWTGRCLAARGRMSQARELFERACRSLPAEASVWRQRIEYQLNRLDDGKAPAHEPQWQTEIEKANRLLTHARAVSEIVSPRKVRPAVVAILATIVAAYVVSHSYTIFHTTGTLKISLSCFQKGVLDAASVEAGEYWRLVTYLFLHAHISHLILNLVGLWWFGRLAENLFGTGRFLTIYFVSGILSGLTHIFLSPEMMAVGASGAVMGVFGAATAGIFRCKRLLPESIRRTEVAWMLGLAAAQVALDQVVPHVAVFAHLGGLVAGLVLGLLVPLRKPTA